MSPDKIPPFAFFQDLAARQKGGAAELEAELPRPNSKASLSRKKGSFFLDAAAKTIFRSGFSWKVVEAKWPQTTEAFHGFDIARVAFMDDAEISALAQDTRVIRHRGKLESVRANARFFHGLATEHGSVGRFIAQWPADDVVGLWWELKKSASRLGGNSGPYFLRSVGKDTFLLTGDVCQALMNQGLIEKKPTGKAAQKKVQELFNAWSDNTGLPLCQLSKILACTLG
jgi:3-methyladenine DNA glycosylase Tag